MAYNAIVRVYVRHEASKTDRQITLLKGSGLDALKSEVQLCFSDIIPHDKNSELVFNLFNGTDKFVKISQEHGDRLELKDYDIIYISRKLKDKDSESPVFPHPINDDAQYYIWSLVSQKKGSLMKLSSNKTIECNGKYNDQSKLVYFRARNVSILPMVLYAFTLPGKNNKHVYAIEGQAENNKVTVKKLKEPIKPDSVPDNCKFEALQSFSYTQFRCYKVGGRTDLFLSASKEGPVTLTKGGTEGYPIPNTLFITNLGVQAAENFNH